ncbi:Probable RNA-directed DNA polymerase from transposon BS [Eumeta japonica]|uniref:Probable RNA-directed DNA polymerase from transposon BS n=1 Tax=Eumeta variegata TaxID=151549 RepID=A0A4C1TCG6_EUMVA|nr:Probable RNA-directed DNA polymerase from transposon BS [Eumeta japonica]
MSKKQFGFTRGRSTINAGVELIGKFFEAWEDSRNAIGVFYDVSKTFVCVNHETLIKELHHYGVMGRALDLRALYLTNRVQKVDVNNMRSSRSVVRMGVPQRSILELNYCEGNSETSKNRGKYQSLEAEDSHFKYQCSVGTSGKNYKISADYMTQLPTLRTSQLRQRSRESFLQQKLPIMLHYCPRRGEQ